jgi:hypothetical protein
MKSFRRNFLTRFEKNERTCNCTKSHIHRLAADFGISQQFFDLTSAFCSSALKLSFPPRAILLAPSEQKLSTDTFLGLFVLFFHFFPFF